MPCRSAPPVAAATVTRGEALRALLTGRRQNFLEVCLSVILKWSSYLVDLSEVAPFLLDIQSRFCSVEGALLKMESTRGSHIVGLVRSEGQGRANLKCNDWMAEDEKVDSLGFTSRCAVKQVIRAMGHFLLHLRKKQVVILDPNVPKHCWYDVHSSRTQAATKLLSGFLTSMRVLCGASDLGQSENWEVEVHEWDGCTPSSIKDDGMYAAILAGSFDGEQVRISLTSDHIGGMRRLICYQLQSRSENPVSATQLMAEYPVQ